PRAGSSNSGSAAAAACRTLGPRPGSSGASRRRSARRGAEFGLSDERSAGVLPALVDRLEAVTIRIEDVGRVISRVVIEARARLAVISGARGHCGCVEGVHLGLASGDEADMGRVRIGAA